MINSHKHHSNYTDKMDRRHCQEYVQSLEEERRKIQVFSRELPLCLELITQAIEAYKQQSAGTTTTEYNLNGQPECSEQTSSDVPVLEEFIPLKRITCSDEDDDDEHESHKSSDCNSSKNNDKASKKSDWLRSVQLWNQTPDPIPNEESSPRKVSVTEVKRNVSGGGAFHPFKKEKTSPATESPPDRSDTVAAASSTAENGGGSKKESESQRKQRRCWSAELHRRFLQALQQLGGSHVATPKQIRDLMKVDGLTNDEVKSHLQKYRLHTRRPSSSIHNNNNNNNQRQPQFVVVGGIWVPPPPEYSAPSASGGEASGVAHSNGIYAPIAAVPKPLQEGRNHSDGGVHSNSPATSSSTHTTTASPTYS